MRVSPPFARTNGCGFPARTTTTRASSDGATSRKQGRDVHLKVGVLSPFVCHLKWAEMTPVGKRGKSR